MNEPDWLLKISENDLEASKIFLNKFLSTSDELWLSQSCYHIQQSIEKSLKFLIANKGREYRKTHEIIDLCGYVSELYENDNSLLGLLDILTLKGNLYTLWESKTRYNINFKENKINVEEAIDLAEELLIESKKRKIQD